MARILLLSFYYPPDLSAAAFRMQSLVRHLREESNDSVAIDLITTMPNRYHAYVAGETGEEEQEGSVRIRRVPVTRHRSGFADQAWAARRYAAGVRRMIRDARYDLVVSTSSRLFTAMLGAHVARRNSCRLYLDIRDIFAETLPEVLPPIFGRGMRPLLSVLEKWSINRADKVNLVSPGFAEWYEKRYPGRAFSYHTNGVDGLFSGEDAGGVPMEHPSRRERLSILYAGNVGEGQGLHRIIPGLSRSLVRTAYFRIIGAGGRMAELQKAVSGLENIAFIPPVSRTELRAEYENADVLFVHLNHYESLRRSLPSKIFEYAETGKPILAGVTGYAAEFIRDQISNAAVFNPGDVEGAVRALNELDMRTEQRTEFVRKYDRGRIMRDMARDILTLAGG